jgi:hypothetical protein
MKYIIGSLIISFGILLVLLMVSISMNLKAPENGMKYFMIAWGVLAVLAYPLAKKIIRD